MIRFIGQSLGMAVVAALFGTGAALTVARGQNGFVDDESHVPPRPGAPMAGGYPAQSTSAADFVPPATVTNPPQSASTTPSPAYNMTTVPGSNPRQMAAPGTFGAGMKMTAKVGAYGIGGKRPDGRAAPDASRRVTPVTHTAPVAGPKAASPVKSAGHFDDISESAFPPSVPPPEGSMPAPLFSRLASPLSPPMNPPGMSFPTDRTRPPMITGTHLGLPPGESGTERALRLMTAVGELERQVDGMGQRNAELNQLVKQRDDQLLLAIREIKSTRKEVQTARDELDFLRQQVKALQEKVHSADRDNAALIQTMAPLLQKLLESDHNNPSNSSEE